MGKKILSLIISEVSVIRQEGVYWYSMFKRKDGVIV